MDNALIIIVAVVLVVSLIISPRSKNDETFFGGLGEEGQQPKLLTLIFSQVTTWIFARSLMNSAILGYYYGIWGTLAYAAYYVSFLTGGLIIDRLRFQCGHSSLQTLLTEQFGKVGTACFNVVIALRLVSEVFANLLVIGLLFGTLDSRAYVFSIIGISLVTLLYAMLGGLRGSLRTDVLQFSLFAITLVVVVIALFSHEAVDIGDVVQRPFVLSEPGPILLIVAFLQVWSYPAHDPVMMDRGFLADRKTTWWSFIHAFWVSAVCIIAFGIIGIVAGVHKAEGEEMTQTIARLLGEVPMLLFNLSLVISAMSTLDSTLSSASKLVVKDMAAVKPTVTNGRLAMFVFMLAGLLMVFLGSKDLFSAVAVSGTASMFLAPLIFFTIWGGVKNIPLVSYLIAFVLAIGGAVLYFTESSKYTALLGDAHKYTKLLWISLVILAVSCAAFAAGMSLNSPSTADEKEPT